MAPRSNYDLVRSIEELGSLVQRVMRDGLPFALDIETGYRGEDTEKGSLSVETNLLAGISFTNSTDWARYAPLGHDLDENLDNYQAARLLWPMLNTGLGVAHNAVFELRNLSRWFREQLSDDPDYGEAVRASRGYFPIRSDTQVEAYLVAAYQKFGLKYLTKEMFGHTMTELADLFPDLAKNKQKYLRFNTLPLDRRAIEYACEDSVWCLAIHEKYYPQVCDTLLYKVEREVLACVCDMEDSGLRFDWAAMRRAAEQLREFQSKFNAEIMAELTELCGEPIAINLNSPAKVSEILYTRLGMSTTVYTAKTKELPREQRKMSTGKIALTGLSKKHPVVKKILQWKEMSKLLGSYLDKFEPRYGGAPDGNVHAGYLSAVVITGRFASSEPNVQNLPKTYHYDLDDARLAHQRHIEDHGKDCGCDDPAYAPPPGTCFRLNFRDVVVAPPDHYILGFDLSQAELRAIAGEAREQSLLDAFAAGTDVHALTASLMLTVPLDEVTKDHRSVGKTMNFALLYLMGVKSLADRLGKTVDEAQQLYDQYFAAYSRIRAWSDKQQAFGKANGFVLSHFGRRLPIWEFKSDKRWIYQKGERACVNYPIQSSATGDYMKIAMVRARRALHNAGLADRVHMVMNVHDALEFSVHRSVMPHEVIAALQRAVIFPVTGWPQMKADWHIAKRWGSPRELELADDGRIEVKGEKTYELVPQVVEDEETGEAEVELPEEDIEAVCRVLTPAQTSDDPRTVIVVIDDMPAMDAYLKFRELVDALPGQDSLVLRTPEGELPLPATTSLSPAHLAQVSMCLGPTKIIYAGSDVDAAAFMEGISL